MAANHVVSGLISKSTEIISEITVLQAKIAELNTSLEHVQQTIKIFEPEFDLRSLKGKRVHKRNIHFGHGEQQRLILDILRVAGQPLNEKDLIQAVFDRKKIEADTNDSRHLKYRFLIRLRKLKASGMVASSVQDGEVYWRLTD